MKLTTLREFRILEEMAAKKACPVCGHGMANFHFYRNGGWYCKTTSLKAPAPGADISACQDALAKGQAPRVSGGTPTPASTPSPTGSKTSAPSSKGAAAQIPDTQPAPQYDALQQKIDAWLKANDIENYTINGDNTVSIAGDLELIGLRHKTLPVTFDRIDGDVIISGGLLENLKGLPNEIGGELSISSAADITLIGAPQIMDSLSIRDVMLMTLKHGQFKEIKNNIHLQGIPLTDFVGLPNKVDGDFYYRSGTSPNFDGFPNIISGDLDIQCNNPKGKIKSIPLIKVGGATQIIIPGLTAPNFSSCDGPLTITLSQATGPITVPDVVNGSLIVRHYDGERNLTFAALPSEVKGDLEIPAWMIENVSNIHKQLKRVDGKITLTRCADVEYSSAGGGAINSKLLAMNLGPVLGLARIKGVTRIDFMYDRGVSARNGGPLQVVQDAVDRVISGDIDVIEAQEILIDAGFKVQAKM